MSDSSIKEPQENPRQNVNPECPTDTQRQEKDFGESNYHRAVRHYFRAAEQFVKSGNVESAARAARRGSIEDPLTPSPDERTAPSGDHGQMPAIKRHVTSIAEGETMFTKKLFVSVMIAAGTLGAVATPLPGKAEVGVSVQLNFGPPPERIEVVPAPRQGYVWAPGYWDWRGERHVWVKGHWLREREGYVYQPHRWVERDGRWALEHGRWDHEHRDHGQRDSDRDGVPDRFDRRPNNPNRS